MYSDLPVKTKTHLINKKNANAIIDLMGILINSHSEKDGKTTFGKDGKTIFSMTINFKSYFKDEDKVAVFR